MCPHPLYFLLLLPLLINPSPAHSLPCRISERLINGTCTPCPAGSFLDTPETCRPCVRGTFRATPGATEFIQCIPCPANTFSDSEGSSRCRPCPTGTISPPFARICTRTCPPGQEIYAFSQNGCAPCRAGFFKPQEGAHDSCVRCPSGTYTNGPGASRCRQCPPGTFQRNSALDFDSISVFSTNGCPRCEAGTFSNGRGSTRCERCGPGMFSLRGARSCTPCPNGFYNNLLVAENCRRCAEGTFTVGQGAAACKDRLSGCPLSTFENNDGECSACMPGERLDVETRTCVPCPEGQISDGGVSEVCTPCASGKIPFGISALFEKGGCVCAPGTIDDGSGGCIPCPVGTFWENNQAFFQHVTSFRRTHEPDVKGICSLCEPGTFSDEPGLLACKRCPENTFQDREGQTSCMNCPQGFTSLERRDEDRTRCVDRRLVCSKGEVRRSLRRCSSVTCCAATNTSCRPGSVRIFSQCSTCRPGHVPDGNNTCVPCPPSGQGGDGTRCAHCDRSRRFELNRLKSCSCWTGYGREGTRCVRCKPGTFSNKLGNFDRVCSNCPKGRYRDGRGRFTSCRRCPPGKVAPNEGSRRCTPCPDGTEVAIDIFGRRHEECRPI